MLGIPPWALRPLCEQDVRVPILQMTKLSLREAWRLTRSHSWKEVGDHSSPASLHSQVLAFCCVLLYSSGHKAPWGLNQRQIASSFRCIQHLIWASEGTALRLDYSPRAQAQSPSPLPSACGTLSQLGLPGLPNLIRQTGITVILLPRMMAVRHR